jgi:O-antigen/teichoic acid export membrane protein
MESRLNARTLISNSVTQTLMGIIQLVAAFFLVPVFVDAVGASLYGVWIISYSLTGPVGFLDLGFTDGLLRFAGKSYAGRNWGEFNRVIWAALLLLIAVGLLSGAVLFGLSEPLSRFFDIPDENRLDCVRLIQITAIVIMIAIPLRLPVIMLRAALLHRVVDTVVAAQTVASTLALIAAAQFTSELYVLRMVAAVLTTLGGLGLCYLALKNVPRVSFVPPRGIGQVLWAMSGYSLGMLYTRLISFVAIQIDPLLIGRLAMVSQVTTYSIISKPFQALTEISRKFLGSLPSSIHHLEESSDPHRMARFVYETTKFRSLFTIPLALTGILFLPAFIELWVGGEFASAAVWGQLFLIIPIVSVLGIGVNLLRQTGRVLIANLLLTFRGLVNVVVSVSLIPHLGFGGAIIGTLIASTVFGDILLYPVACRICRIPPWSGVRIFGRVLTACIPPFLIAAFLLDRFGQPTSWWQLVLAAALCYTAFWACLYIMVLDRRDNEYLRMAVSYPFAALFRFGK